MLNKEVIERHCCRWSWQAGRQVHLHGQHSLACDAIECIGVYTKHCISQLSYSC